MTSENDKSVISVREAAKECGRNMETVRRWIWAGKLPAEKLGNQLFIKKNDFVSFCRETAVREYDAKLKPDFLERAKTLREQMETSGGKHFNAAKDIRKMSEEHDDELKSSSQGDTAMKYEETGKKEDFLERAIRFRSKLKARGYPAIDAADMVRKSREGRMRELRQSLR